MTIFRFILLVNLIGFNAEVLASSSDAQLPAKDVSVAEVTKEDPSSTEKPRVFLFRAEAPTAKPQLLHYGESEDDRFKNVPIITISKSDENPNKKIYETKQVMLEKQVIETVEPVEPAE